nr:ATP-binding protein [Paenibacillus profundus]
MEYVALQQNEQVSMLVEQLLTAELDGRRRAKLGKLVQQAGFPNIKTFEGYVNDHMWRQSGHVSRVRMARAQREFAAEGAVGTGKTHMATALGVEACRRGKTVKSTGLPTWLRSCRRSLRQAQ